MSIVHAIVLGIVQGVAEYMPISSSGHLILVPWLLGWDDFAGNESLAKTFDVALHVGTLVGALIVQSFASGLSLAGVDDQFRVLAIGILVILAVSALLPIAPLVAQDAPFLPQLSPGVRVRIDAPGVLAGSFLESRSLCVHGWREAHFMGSVRRNLWCQVRR